MVSRLIDKAIQAGDKHHRVDEGAQRKYDAERRRDTRDQSNIRDESPRWRVARVESMAVLLHLLCCLNERCDGVVKVGGGFSTGRL